MRTLLRRGVMTALAAVALTACQSDLTIPNFNAATVEGLSADPAGIQLAATGILVSERNNYTGYIRDVSIFGREGYYYFATDSRYVTDYLIGANATISPTGFASGNWFGYFRNMRNAVNLVELANKSSLAEAQKSAARGFASTFRALDMYYALSLRDTLGIPVEILANPNERAPFVARAAAYARISAVFDSARADLVAAGTSSFPFVLHSGFAGFDTPATFLRVNRGLAARVLAIRGSLECGNACYTQALAALAESFVTAPGAATSMAQLNTGVYNIYSTSSGDATNTLSSGVDPNFVAHASLAADAMQKTDGTSDARALRKVALLASPRVGNPANRSIPATYGQTVYASNSTPTPIIRNEELILIRAEANLRLGNPGAALIDLNTTRTVSGGLTPGATATLDDLLYERRYSLYLEGFRWIDARRFGRLNTLPLDLSTHFVARVVPIPKAECDARDVKPNGC